MSMRVETHLAIDAHLGDLEEATPEALVAGMEVIRAIAAPYTPVETGRLVGSASIAVDGDDATLSYDGPYARYQHERLDLRHETGRAKYLELATIEGKDEAVRVVGERLGF